MRRIVLVSALLVTTLAGSVGPAVVLTKDAAIERCRMTVGKSVVIACMRSGGGSIDACRDKARPQVVACVVAALNTANRRDNVAVAIPTGAAPS
jgi:hypothetical protein